MKTKDAICLGVIPARGGSKGVPRKNIRDFAGTTLVEIAVKAAAGSKYLTETIVNTDCMEIAAVARKCGGNVPFIRPKELGTDDIPVKDITRHTALWYENERGRRPDIIVTLQPTSPFRTSEHLDEAIKMLLESDAEGVIGLTEAEHTPYKMRLIEDGRTYELFPGKNVVQRQDAPPVYRLNGIVYATKWDTLISKRSLWGDNSLPLVLPEEVAFNIDTVMEFEMAEWQYKRLQGIDQDTDMRAAVNS